MLSSESTLEWSVSARLVVLLLFCVGNAVGNTVLEFGERAGFEAFAGDCRDDDDGGDACEDDLATTLRRGVKMFIFAWVIMIAVMVYHSFVLW